MSVALAAAAAASGLAVFAQKTQNPRADLPPGLVAVLFSAIWLLAVGFKSITKGVFGGLTSKQLSGAFALVTSVTLVCMAGMGYMDSKFRTPELPLGVVTFEFGFTSAKMKTIINAWSREQLVWVVYAQGTDNLFMFLYSNAIALGCLVAGGRSARAYDIAVLQYVAGLLDFLEGVFLHLVLIEPNLDKLDERIPLGAGISAAIKFAFIIVGFIYFFSVLALSRAASPASSTKVQSKTL